MPGCQWLSVMRDAGDQGTEQGINVNERRPPRRMGNSEQSNMRMRDVVVVEDEDAGDNSTPWMKETRKRIYIPSGRTVERPHRC